MSKRSACAPASAAFCRAHGARTTSDPNGAMRIRIRDSEKLQRYRFGLKTADFLICRACGVFVGALMDEERAAVSSRSTPTRFKPPPAYDIIAVANDFGAEDTRRTHRPPRAHVDTRRGVCGMSKALVVIDVQKGMWANPGLSAL